jgi:hypothetical protein
MHYCGGADDVLGLLAWALMYSESVISGIKFGISYVRARF